MSVPLFPVLQTTGNLWRLKKWHFTSPAIYISPSTSGLYQKLSKNCQTLYKKMVRFGSFGQFYGLLREYSKYGGYIFYLTLVIIKNFGRLLFSTILFSISLMVNTLLAVKSKNKTCAHHVSGSEECRWREMQILKCPHCFLILQVPNRSLFIAF